MIGSLRVIIASICWGTLGIFSIGLGKLGFDSFQIATLRIVTAGAVILLLLPQLFPATKASVSTIIEPLTAIILATVLLKQPLQVMQMVGIRLIIFAILANALGNKPNAVENHDKSVQLTNNC